MQRKELVAEEGDTALEVAQLGEKEVEAVMGAELIAAIKKLAQVMTAKAARGQLFQVA